MFNIPSFFGFQDAGKSVPLLDAFPGAAAAYSLRKLRTAYTGSAIRVRRASDNTEQDIGFVNDVLDTSTLTTFCSGTNGFVTTCYDQSGNGRNATQSTAANQPQVVSSGSVILENNKPCLRFDGTNDYLFSNFGSTIIQPNSNFIVTTMPTTFFGFIYDSSPSNRQALLRDGNNSRLDFFCGIDLITSNLIDLNQYLIETLASGISSKVYANSNIIGNGNPGSNSISNLYIGSGNFIGNYSNMDFQELIFYPSDQSSNRTGINTNINDFYSIY